MGASSWVYCVGGASGSCWMGMFWRVARRMNGESGPGNAVANGGVGKHSIVDPTLCLGLVELESYAGERGGGGANSVGDALLVHEERNVIHVSGDKHGDVVHGKCDGYLAYGVRVVSRRRRLPLGGQPMGTPLVAVSVRVWSSPILRW